MRLPPRATLSAVGLALALVLAVPPSIPAQPTNQVTQRSLFATYNLNTPTIAATTNYIVTSVDFASVTLTLAHQPDTPRNLTSTLTDIDASCSGTLTITGTDVDGNVISDALSAATLRAVWTGTKLYNTISSAVITGAAGCGAGVDTIVIGVGSSVAPIYCRMEPGTQVITNIKTSGSSTTVTAVGSTTPFADVAVGDELTVLVPPNVRPDVRYVVTRTSATQVSVRAPGNADSGIPAQPDAVNWDNSAAGYPFTWRRQSCGYSRGAGWVPTEAVKTVAFEVTQLGATGGIVMSVECQPDSRGILSPIQVIQTTYTSAVWPNNVDTIPILETCSGIRVGLRFGTTDDASDTIPERVSVTLYSQAK
jgi:hypothetical protein